ncbi:hypothetical protein [Acinetobacter sp. MYb191]|uniref:hypothetical protein n=1 Tax=Acinetobacter sp. MYb191 TaxID=1848593 RepID=UPI0030A94A66
MGGSSSQTIGQRYFAKLTTFIGNPIEKLVGINFDNRGWIFKPDNGDAFLRVESPNLYGDKEGGVAGFIDIHTGTADQMPNTTYSADFPKVSGYPFQSYLLFRGLGKKPATSGGIGQFTRGSPKHYNNSFYHGNSGYMKEMLLWPQRIRVRNDGRPQWYAVREDGIAVCEIAYGEFGGVGHIQPKTNFSITAMTRILNDILGGQQESSEVIEKNAYEPGEEIQTLGLFSGAGGTQQGYLSAEKNFIVTTPGRLVFVLEVRSGYNIENLIANVSISNQKAKIVRDELIQSSDYWNVKKWHVEILNPVDNLTVSFALRIESVEDQYDPNVKVAELAVLSPTSLKVFSFIDSSTTAADINPIHKIREILTDDTAMSKPESDVNEQNFMKAADKIWDEGLGVSWSVTEKSCLEAINELCGHIEAGIRINRQTGLYEIVLFRDDWFEEAEIHTLPFNKIKSMQLDGATSADELINKLNVSYYNREALKNSSFSVAETAAIRNLNGHENVEEVKFPYFMSQRNAAVVAQWKLKQMSTPVWQGTFTTGFYQARKWNRYDLLKLEWPRRWVGSILVRIMKINLGTGTDVSIDFVEIVPYSSNLSSSIVIDTPVDTTPKPPQPALFKSFELSYFEAVQLHGQKYVEDALTYNPDAGYVAVIAKRPQSNSLSALMYTDVGNDYEHVASVQYSETAELDQNISQTHTAFIVKKVGDIDLINKGMQITVNNEIMVYQSYDDETGLLTVKRGALDTIPQNHLAGSVLYFADDFITVDPTEYVTGEIINVKTLTTTPSGILDLDDVDAQQVEIQARAIRPYPPANVKVNGVYWPKMLAEGLTLTWVNRNRVQQTGGEILGWFDQGVNLESDVQTFLTFTELSETGEELASNTFEVTHLNEYVHPISEINPLTQDIRLILKTMRLGYTCLNAFVHKVRLSDYFSEPLNLNVEVTDQSGEPINLAVEYID